MMTRPGLRLALTLGFAAALAACASILDIKALPLVPNEGGDDGGALAETGDGDGGGGSDGCAPRGTSFCQSLCPAPTFCDDFEGPELAKGWEAPLGFQNPVVSGTEGHVSLGRDDAGAQSQALFAMARSDNSSSANAVILNSFSGKPGAKGARGVHLRFDLRVSSISWLNDGGSSVKSTTVFAFGSEALNQGFGVNLYGDEPGKLRLGILQRALGGGKGIEYQLIADVFNGDTANFVQNWLPIDITVGSPALLAERKIACTIVPDPDAGYDAGPDDTRLVIQMATARKCTTFADPLIATDWLSATTIIVGASVSDFGNADVRIDNVLVDFYP